jgi:phage tail sheath gpL-like
MLTSIGSQKTPARPIELTFAAETGIPSADQEVLLIGHKDAASGSATPYTVVEITNAGNIPAASAEVAAAFGDGSELAKMVLAAIRANLGGSQFPALKCVALASTDTGFGASDAALTAAARVKQEYVVSPYDGVNTTLRGKIKDHAKAISGANNVENNQYGTVSVAATRGAISTLDEPDTEYFAGAYLRDTGTGDDAPAYSLAEVAAAAAARMAANTVPFNPQDDLTIGGLDAPKKKSDHITVGGSLESESILEKGWIPLRVKPNGEVAFVRTVTSRITVDADGVTDVTAYYDVPDFNVLYFWRKTLKTRFSQADFKRRKNSGQTKKLALSEMIRLAKLFEDQGMFQAVDKLAPLFKVENNASDRHRIDYKTPVNVIPGLHVMAGNIEATTQFDVVTV